MSQKHSETDEHSDNGDQLQDIPDQNKSHKHSETAIENTHPEPLQESNITLPKKPRQTRTNHKANAVSRTTFPRGIWANVEIIFVTFVVIVLLWIGVILLWYIADGWLAFLGLLVSGIATLSTFIGVFWPVFLKDVWNFMKDRHPNKGGLFRKAALVISLFMILASFGVYFWGFDPYHHFGWTSLNDSLSGNDLYWHERLGNNKTVGSCLLEGGSYHVSAYPKHLHYCIATATDFSNFVYEVQLKYIQGDCGGVVFRADYANNKDYVFVICRNLTYCLTRYDSQKIFQALIGCNGDTNSLHRILNNDSGITQFITLAVVARENNFELWVNHQQLDVAFDFSDQEMKEGEIGIAADAPTQYTEVAFSNAKIWTLYGG